MRQKKALVTLNISHHPVLLIVLPFRLEWSRRGNLFFHLEFEFSCIGDSAPAPAGLFPCPGGLEVNGVPQECTVEPTVIVRGRHFILLCCCASWAGAFPRCKTGIPHKGWERCCLERTEQINIERSTVTAGKPCFLCSHCLGSC